MKISVVFTAYQRPHYLQETLASWAEVRGIDDVQLYLYLEPSDVMPEMLGVIKDSGLPIETTLNETRLGVLVNPWTALNDVFRRTGAGFTVLAEEDIVVSQDVLEYFTEATARCGPQRALGVCAFSERSSGDVDMIYLAHHFSPLIWGTWGETWFQHLRDTWDKDYSTHNGIPGVEAGWDYQLVRTSNRTNLPFVHPEVSRSKHIGQFGGAHATPETWASLSCNTFQLTRDPVRRLRWR